MSLLLDPSTRYWRENTLLPPELEQLERTIIEFFKSLNVTMQRVRGIESKTRSQHHSPEWFTARRHRITASVFRLIHHRKPDTPPDALVVNLLEQRQVTSPEIKWGIEHESEALKAYEKHQHKTGHAELTVCSVGFHVSTSHPFLGASPDGGVYDTSNFGEPYGFAEVKCPLKHSNSTPEQACSDPHVCCVLTSSGEICLKNTILTTGKSKGRWLLVFVPGVTLLCTHLKELLLSVCVTISSSGKRTYCLNWKSSTINVLHPKSLALYIS